jgi:hypothetical protein
MRVAEDIWQGKQQAVNTISGADHETGDHMMML